MSESAILCNTEVTNSAAEMFTDSADDIKITYNKVKEVNTELSESWKGKGGDYFTVMGEKMLVAIEESGIFTDEAAKAAFEIARSFKEIDESSAEILPVDFKGKCGLIDPMRNNFLDPMFDTPPDIHYINPVIAPVIGPTTYGEIWGAIEPISGGAGIGGEAYGFASIGVAAYGEGAFVGDAIGTTSGWGVVVNPLLH